jgi:hypothetical protein
MIYNFKNIYNNFDNHINYENYDFVILGSGPSSSVLVEILKKKKKILILEKGNFKKKSYEKIFSKNLKINKYSRTFTVGGTSLDWSQISSYYEENEINRCFNTPKKISWPLKIRELKKYYLKLNYKFNFYYKKIIDSKLPFNIPFSTRFFYAPRKKIFFNKYYNNDFDLIYNCDVKYIDEKKNYVDLYVSKKKIKISSKKVIICCGGIESTVLILKSLKKKFLKKLKNKKFVGKFFMDHPKLNAGTLKYPKNQILNSIRLKSDIKGISYYGISLKKNIQLKYGFLNTYVRFEKVNSKVRNFFNLIKIMRSNTTYSIRCFFEIAPSIKNKIILKKDKVSIDLNFSKIEIKTLNFLIKNIYNYFSEKPNQESVKVFTKKNIKTEDASHHMGGLIYPKIVDKNLKLNGLSNIYVCSSAIFPTSGSANPTLTICALAYRLAKHLNKI